MLEFEYRKERSELVGEILRPVADLKFKSTKEDSWIEVEAYIDSGADITLIPLSLGKLLGFEFGKDNIKELSGISEGKISVIIKKVPLRLGDIELNIRVAWALIEEVPALLGRLDVFDRFRIIFDEKKKKIFFNLNKK